MRIRIGRTSRQESQPPSQKHSRHPQADVFWDQIKCIPGCGGCCPQDCRHFSRETSTCRVHPPIGATAEETERNLAIAREQGFGHGCHLGPSTLFSWYHGCPVIIEILERMLGEKIETFYTSRGQSILTDADDTLELTRRACGWDLAPGEPWPPSECVRQDVDAIYAEVKNQLTPLLSQGIRHWR